MNVMRKAITYFYLISGSLLTASLWALQEAKNYCAQDCFLVKNSFTIGLTISVIVLILSLSYCVLYYNSDKIILDKWVHMLLEHILEQYLAKDSYNTRLTVFKPKMGWKTWGYYICHVLLGNLWDNFKKGRLLLAFSNFPIHGRTIYLQQSDRVASTKNPGSMTIFKTTVRGESYDGIADKCYRENHEYYFATATSLNGIVIPEKYPEGADDNSRIIRDYMSAMYLGREYYDVLRGMNFKTKQALAFPLRMPDESIWGIVVIDTDDNIEKTLEELLKDHIGDYKVMFRSMGKSLK